MSTQNENQMEIGNGGRSIEPWLVVSFASLVPLVVAMLLPESWRMPLYVIGGVLCAIGIALLFRQESSRGR